MVVTQALFALVHSNSQHTRGGLEQGELVPGTLGAAPVASSIEGRRPNQLDHPNQDQMRSKPMYSAKGTQSDIIPTLGGKIATAMSRQSNDMTRRRTSAAT